MEKRGGRGRGSSHEDPREKNGLGTADLIAIVVVITLLVTALGAFVADRSMRAAHPGTSWTGRLTESVASIASIVSAEEAPPTSPTAR
jgi:hypothetical protein